MQRRRRVCTWLIALYGGLCHFCWGALASAQWALPSDVRIEPPGPEVPASIAAFSGVWAGGAWDGILPHVLIVERVSATGDAAVISSWGDAPDWQLTRGYTRVQGRIDHGHLLLDTPAAGHGPSTSSTRRVPCRARTRAAAPSARSCLPVPRWSTWTR